MRIVVQVSLLILVLNLLQPSCDALRNYGSSYKHTNRGYNSVPEKPKSFVGTSSGLPSQNASRKGLGISAWGIVMIIVSLFVAGMGFYYFTICYPILCKKTRKYDMIGLPSVV